MEEKKTIFDYLAQIMIVFGFTMLVMNIFCILFGEQAKSVSAMFALGSRGVSVRIAFQLLCIVIFIVGVRFLFFTDVFIKKMPIWLRTISMLSCIIVIIAVFIIVFDWFPADMWQSWAMFFICFGVSFAGSYFVMIIRERVENKRMEEALKRLKEREGDTL